jgi:hypothetical protein
MFGENVDSASLAQDACCRRLVGALHFGCRGNGGFDARSQFGPPLLIEVNLSGECLLPLRLRGTGIRLLRLRGRTPIPLLRTLSLPLQRPVCVLGVLLRHCEFLVQVFLLFEGVGDRSL